MEAIYTAAQARTDTDIKNTADGALAEEFNRAFRLIKHIVGKGGSNTVVTMASGIHVQLVAKKLVELGYTVENIHNNYGWPNNFGMRVSW